MEGIFGFLKRKKEKQQPQSTQPAGGETLIMNVKDGKPEAQNLNQVGSSITPEQAANVNPSAGLPNQPESNPVPNGLDQPVNLNARPDQAPTQVADNNSTGPDLSPSDPADKTS